MQNSIGLSISQNIGFTGGRLSIYTDLSRIDQFGVDAGKTWYAQPVTLYYEQPLLAYNRFKWEKKISPRQYERAKRVYIESMEQVTINAVHCYFNLMLARRNHEAAMTNYQNTRQMYSIAAQRLKLGSVTREEYLQLELRMVNDSISINENEIALSVVKNGKAKENPEFYVDGISGGTITSNGVDAMLKNSMSNYIKFLTKK